MVIFARPGPSPGRLSFISLHRSPMTVATALSHSNSATPELVGLAVQAALRRMGQTRASSILLFLTSDFNRCLDDSIRSAARAGNTLQVTGCSAIGVMTEDDWVIDGPAVAVMVFATDPARILAPEHPGSRLALAAPNAINTLWLDGPLPLHGGVSGDITGQGPYTVWGQSRIAKHGHVEYALDGYCGEWLVSPGLSPVGDWQWVTRAANLELYQLDHRAAVTSLQTALEQAGGLPGLERVYALTDSAEPIPVLSLHAEAGYVVLGRPLAEGRRLRWAVRRPESALAEVQHGLQQLPHAPQFGLMFSSAGRGPNLYNGRDEEWQAVRQRWPGMPLLGLYGNGEIAYAGGGNRVLTNSTVLGVFEDS